MSIIKTLPKDSRFRQTVNRFTATFNTPSLGQYNFEVPANTLQSVLPLDNKLVYFIDSMSFSADITEGSYLTNIDTFPECQLFYKQGNRVVYVKPIPLVQYYDGVSTDTFAFSTMAQDGQIDELQISMRGILNQNASLVGVGEINAQVSFNIFEVINQEWINNFRRQYPNGYWEKLGIV